MKLTNNGEDRTPTGHILSPNKASSTRNWLHPIELLAEGVPWKLPHSFCYQDYGMLYIN